MSINGNKSSAVTLSSPLVKNASKGKGLNTVAEKSGKLKLHLRQDEPNADSLDWYGNLPLHHAATVDPPDIAKVRALLQEYPEGSRTRNQFGRLPLHCAVDKIYCNAELIQILLNAYPDGASEEDDDGFTPLSCALRWEHSDKILKIILMENRYQYRGLYFAMRYGKILGSMIYCMDSIFSKPKTLAAPSYSASAATSYDVGVDSVTGGSGDMGSYSHDQAEQKHDDEVPTLCLSPPTSSKGKPVSPPNSGFQGGYPEIVIGDDSPQDDSTATGAIGSAD